MSQYICRWILSSWSRASDHWYLVLMAHSDITYVYRIFGYCRAWFRCSVDFRIPFLVAVVFFLTFVLQFISDLSTMECNFNFFFPHFKDVDITFHNPCEKMAWKFHCNKRNQNFDVLYWGQLQKLCFSIGVMGSNTNIFKMREQRNSDGCIVSSVRLLQVHYPANNFFASTITETYCRADVFIQ